MIRQYGVYERALAIFDDVERSKGINSHGDEYTRLELKIGECVFVWRSDATYKQPHFLECLASLADALIEHGVKHHE